MVAELQFNLNVFVHYCQTSSGCWFVSSTLGGCFGKFPDEGLLSQFWFVIQWSLKVANKCPLKTAVCCGSVLVCDSVKFEMANKRPLKTAVCCGLVRRLRVPDSRGSSSHPGVLFPLKCLPLPPPPLHPKWKVCSGQTASLHPPPPPPLSLHESMPHGHSISLTQSPHLSHSHPICPIDNPSLSQSLHQSHSHPISLTVIPSVPQSPHLSQSSYQYLIVTTISPSHPISPKVTQSLPQSPHLSHSNIPHLPQLPPLSPNHPIRLSHSVSPTASPSLSQSLHHTVTPPLQAPHLSQSHPFNLSLSPHHSL